LLDSEYKMTFECAAVCCYYSLMLIVARVLLRVAGIVADESFADITAGFRGHGLYTDHWMTFAEPALVTAMRRQQPGIATDSAPRQSMSTSFRWLLGSTVK
jgi:hypothetical protein